MIKQKYVLDTKSLYGPKTSSIVLIKDTEVIIKSIPSYYKDLTFDVADDYCFYTSLESGSNKSYFIDTNINLTKVISMERRDCGGLNIEFNNCSINIIDDEDELTKDIYDAYMAYYK